MKKIYLSVVLLFLLSSVSLCTKAQLTGTLNIPGAYLTLASAIADLNAQGVGAGGVTLNLIAGTPQTTPAGGFVIGNTGNILVGATNPTAANPVIIQGNGNTITAFTPQTVGNLNDAIFKIIGADFITIQHFTMQENAANTINATALTNNMTEWGVALLRASTTDGAQNNTIQNNTISLNIAYRNTFGIYSNVRHAATTPTSFNDPTALSGSNLGNKVYANSISNVMMGMLFIGTSTAALQDAGNDIGGSSAATGNTINNWGGNVQLSLFQFNLNNSYCIYSYNQTADNISYNTINSGTVGTGVATAFFGIRKDYSSSPTGTFTSTISYNTITMASNFTGGSTFTAINNSGMVLSTATTNINNNNIVNCTCLTNAVFGGILNLSAPGTLNMTNNIIRGYTSVSGAFTGISNTGAVANTINITNNKIGDAVAGAATYSTANISGLNAITNTGGAAAATVNLNNNSIDGFTVVNMATVNFIQNTAGSVAAVNINNNQLGSATGSLISFSGIQSSALNGIINTNGNAAMAVSIQNNDFRGIVNTQTCTASQQYINSQAAVFSSNISNNTFTNLSINSSVSVNLILKGGIMAAGASSIVSNNSIFGSFSKTTTGGSVYGYNSGAASVSGSTLTITGNNFSNITIAGATLFYGINDVEGASSASGPAKTISGNTISNVTMGSGALYAMFIDKGENLVIGSNTISNISSTGAGDLHGIYHLSNIGTGVFDIAANTISTLSSTLGAAYGIIGGAATPTTINIHNNTITGLSSGGPSKIVAGINNTSGQVVNIYDNDINSFTGSSTCRLHGIWIGNGTTTNIYRNDIHNLQQNGAVASGPTIVNGILLSNGTAITAYNNFISDLKAPNADLTDAVRGISVISTTAATNYNLYYNSIYLNASSTGLNFGTAGIYHTTNLSPTTAALTMINNIVVNTSTANGTGVIAAYRRSGTELDNYTSTSDYNLFYAGTPSTTNLIFYDGTNSDETLAAYQTRVSTRDANSISLMPTFTSTTDLHVTTANCRIEARGIPVAAVTDDIDLAVRNATTPDIGADEFTATTSTALAGSAGGAVCEDRIIAVTGTTYTSNACDLIARVFPIAPDPVAGKVNVCVTLDATQQYFNGEPYVQRHFDIEPTTGNQTSTSATITLYFTNNEFVLYNSTNPVWPKLPTSTLGNTDPNRANVKITQFHGAATTSPSSPGNYPGAAVLITPVAANVFWNGTYWAVTFNVVGFSGFYVHTNNFNATLPVTVNYLTGRKQGSNHLLNWKVTCNSTPRVTMTLERSADARNYTGLNTIAADAARCQQPFDYTDANPLKGMNYYRLKMVDANGSVTYSTTVALLNAVKGFDIISMAPNPVINNNFKLNVASAQAGKMDISIFDLQSRLVNRQTLSVIAGFNSLPVNVANLSPGTYTIKGFMADEQFKIIRFVKQ